MTDPQRSKGNFLVEGWRELQRKLARMRLRGTLRGHDRERQAALTALGQRAWDEKVDLAAFPALRERLAGLDARVGEINAATGNLDKEREQLEAKRRAELEAFGARRKAVEEEKAPVDAALRQARTARAGSEQQVRQAEARLTAIAGRLAALDREIAAAAEGDPKGAAAKTERATLAAEQAGLGPKLAAAREALPGHAAEETRLDAASSRLASQLAAIEAEQKAALRHVDDNLARVRKQVQEATQQASAANRERTENFGALGGALYDAKVDAPALSEGMARIASIDQARAQAASGLDDSLAQSRAVPGGTLATFWLVIVGVPVILAALGFGAWRYLHRPAAPTPAVASAPAPTPARGEGCEVKGPLNGRGVNVDSGCVRREGTFLAGRLHGPDGRIQWPGGELQQGRFYNGWLAGPGARVYGDGVRIEGTFANGQPAGPGKITLPDGTVYEGRLWGRSLLGWGVRRGADGVIVAGDWREGPDNRTVPIGTMLRVRPDGTREKVEASDLDPTVPKPNPEAAQAAAALPRSY